MSCLANMSMLACTAPNYIKLAGQQPLDIAPWSDGMLGVNPLKGVVTLAQSH